MKMLRKYRLLILLALSCLSAWQAYAGFDLLFSNVDKGGEYWVLTGPLLLFMCTGMGFICSLIETKCKSDFSKRLWGGYFVFLGLTVIVGLLFHIAMSPLQKFYSPWYASLICVSLITIQACILIAVCFSYWGSDSGWNDNSQLNKLGIKAKCLGSFWTITKFLAAVASSILVILASGILLMLWSCTPPSIENLAHRFPAEKDDLEQILQMSDADSQLAVIDPNWLELRDGDRFLTWDKRSGISEDRWNLYRKIFRRHGITQGIRRNKKYGDAFIIVKSFGLLDNGYSNGYLYCSGDIDSYYPPCLLHQERGMEPREGNDHAYSFIRVSDHWYAFSDGPS